MPPSGNRLPQPPWTQAPAEVSAWLESTGGRHAPERPPPRQLRVRGFVLHPLPSEERRLRHRLERLGFERIQGGGDAFLAALDRVARLPPAEVYRGTAAGMRIRVDFRGGSPRRVRFAFSPRITERRAIKILRRLGLDPNEGDWL